MGTIFSGNDTIRTGGLQLAVGPIKFWRKEWLSLTAIGTILATTFDLFLLQRKYHLFTAGFLSASPLKEPGEVAGFILASLVADLAIVGPIVFILLIPFSRMRSYGNGLRLMILIMALSPIILTNFVAYRLAAYLGDAFDLGLMFELVGNNPLEIFAVGFGHLGPLLITFLGIAGIVCFFAWRAKYGSSNPRYLENPKPVMRKIFNESLALFFIGLVAISFVRIQSDRFDHGLRRKPSGRLFGFLVEAVSDLDGDGFGLMRRPPDPAPFDSRIFPYAVDIPGNGIDENGLAGDLPLDAAQYEDSTSPFLAWQYKPDVVFVMLESFRWDVVGTTYGGKAVTPVLDALAKKGVLARHAFSHNGYTTQSRYHLFSGSLVGRATQTSLIDDFKGNGYEVAFFSGQDESFSEEKMPIGIERADIFYDGRSEPHKRYTPFSTQGSLGLPYSVVLEQIASFFGHRKSDRPLFLYLNLYDTHFPYFHRGILPLINDAVLTQSEIRPQHRRDLHSMYLNTVANIDRAIGLLLDQVRQTLSDEVAVIVIADHGESLFDDDFLGHGYMINDAQTKIPLIVSGIPIVIEEPFGQAALRGAINTALTEGPGSDRKPVLKTHPEKPVFQYIGTVSEPRQIAIADLEDRTTYDFRSGLVRIGNKPWRRPETLDASEFRRFRQLVHLWENLLLAKQNV
ncbi:MAG: sulfatase-like hydrolase/transferase [Nitrospiria bacterium]